MHTTVAVTETTLDMLKTVRKDMQAKSFDEVIQKLALQAKKPKQSLFGRMPGLGEFKREDIDRLN